MPVGSSYPVGGNLQSAKQLRKGMGDSPLYRFLEQSAIDDVVLYPPDGGDFQEAALDTTKYWTAVSGGGAAAVAWAIVAAENGTIRATTGTANGITASSSIYSGTAGIATPQFYGARGLDVYCRWKVASALVTDLRFEVGVTDVVPTGTTNSVVNSLVTPTANASVLDAAVYVYDNTSAVTNCGLYTFGNALTAQKTVSTTLGVPVTAVYQWVHLHILGGQVSLFLDGLQVASHNGAIVGTNPVRLWSRIVATSATTKIFDMDVFRARGKRN
ncbi:MAG: hypothetical protein ACRDGM_18085 [bacterium]